MHKLIEGSAGPSWGLAKLGSKIQDHPYSGRFASPVFILQPQREGDGRQAPVYLPFSNWCLPLPKAYLRSIFKIVVTGYATPDAPHECE